MKIKSIYISIMVASTFSVMAAPTKVSFLHSVNGDVVKAFEQRVEEYSGSNENVDVSISFLAGDAYKTKLQALLLSHSKPDLVWTWGGGNYAERARNGQYRDVTDDVQDIIASLPKSAIDAYSVDGRVYGLPLYSNPTALFYNRGLLKKAGVDESELETWEGYLGAIDKLKAANITPIALGGGNIWPANFYFSYLAMRIGGADVFNVALEEGFDSPVFLEAAKQLQRLAKSKPFQPGHMSMDADTAWGYFGNQNAAMLLQGEWAYKLQKQFSVNGEGVPAGDLGLARFPMIEGGKGHPTDIIAGMDGIAFTNSASDEAVNFARYFSSEDSQKMDALIGGMLPLNPEATLNVQDPVMLKMAQTTSQSQNVHGFVDQLLGANLGGVFNDVSASLISGTAEPEEAVRVLQEEWLLR